jgi:tetratricopeptide (TPR) repeat protein
VFGPFHPLVASTVNELGNAAMAHDQLDDAEARFSRMVDIYKKVYGDTNFRTGIALSNLATVYVARKQYARAERIYRDVIRIHTAALSPTHVNTGIARIKLGRALLRQNRFAEAAEESLAGYEIVGKQADPLVSFLHNARTDLAAAYDSLKEPEKAARFHAELAKEKK